MAEVDDVVSTICARSNILSASTTRLAELL